MDIPWTPTLHRTGRPEYQVQLDIMNACPACMDLAVSAFENPPVGSRMAHVAGPLYQRVVRLDHYELVRTGGRQSHGVCVGKCKFLLVIAEEQRLVVAVLGEVMCFSWRIWQRLVIWWWKGRRRGVNN